MHERLHAVLQKVAHFTVRAGRLRAEPVGARVAVGVPGLEAAARLRDEPLRLGRLLLGDHGGLVKERQQQGRVVQQQVRQLRVEVRELPTVDVQRVMRIAALPEGALRWL